MVQNYDVLGENFLVRLAIIVQKCLNRDHPGKILSHLCFSLLSMNIAFICLSFEPKTGGHLCAIVALLLHFFIMSSLAWMCVEALNMYQLLVQVFASSETHFLLKRCLFAWGVPLIIVASTATFKIEAYYEHMTFCMITTNDNYVYYFAFLVPCCLILVANVIIFVIIARVIFAPRLATQNSNKSHPHVTVAQVRGAFTVMVLLGVTWVFGTFSIGHLKIFFQYFFCISNSLQGFLIFLVRCLLYPEARNAWIFLLKTGKLKKHRGVMPPGTVSFSNSHGTKTPAISSNFGQHNDNGNKSPTVALDSSLFSRTGCTHIDEDFKRRSYRERHNLTPYQNGENSKNFMVEEENEANSYKEQQLNTPGIREDDSKDLESYKIDHMRLEYFGNSFENIDLGTAEQSSLEPNLPVDVPAVKDKMFPKLRRKSTNGNSKFSLKAYGKRKFRAALPKKEVTTSEESLEKERNDEDEDDISTRGEDLERISPPQFTKEGIRTFFSNIKKRSNDQKKRRQSQSSNDEDSEISQSVKTENLNSKKEIFSRFPGYKRRSSAVVEQREYNTDDSASTDIEDSPIPATTDLHNRLSGQTADVGKVQSKNVKNNNSDTSHNHD